MCVTAGLHGIPEAHAWGLSFPRTPLGKLIYSQGDVSKGHPASFPFPGTKGPKLRYTNLNEVCRVILPQEKSILRKSSINSLVAPKHESWPSYCLWIILWLDTQWIFINWHIALGVVRMFLKNNNEVRQQCPRILMNNATKPKKIHIVRECYYRD